MFTLGALLLLTFLVGSFIAVVDSVLGLVGLSDTIKKLPVIGQHFGLILSVLVMWFLGDKAGNPMEYWWNLSPHVDAWVVYVTNGAVVYGMIPLRDAIINMVNKGLRA